MAEHSRWDDLKADRLAAMSPEERAAYDEEYTQAGQDLELARLVHQLRIVAGLTQRQLAERMGTTQAAVSRLERGGGGAHRLDTLLRLAEALGRGLRLSFPDAAGDEDASVILREPAA